MKIVNPRFPENVSSPIDFKGIAARADLPAIVAAQGVQLRNGTGLCPWHDNTRTPSLSVFMKNGAWAFKCHSCGAAGSALDWVMLRDSVPIVEAARILDPAAISSDPWAMTIPSRPSAGPRPSLKVVPKMDDAWKDAEWQATADEIVVQAESNLWSKAGREALDWLRRRGFDDATIGRFRLGFVPETVRSKPLEAIPDERTGEPSPIYARRGITMPWIAPDAWYGLAGELDVPRWVGVNVRRLMPNVSEPWPSNDPTGKCRTFRGSTRGYGYPFPDVLPSQCGPPILIVEGEIDALLTWQEVGELAHVVTLGGGKQTPKPCTLEAMLSCSLWLIATDHDKTGDEAAKMLRELGKGRARRLYLTDAKDMGEFVQGGGNVAEWLQSELSRVSL